MGEQYKPTVGDEVVVRGRSGTFKVLDVDPEKHTVALKEKYVEPHYLNFISWSALTPRTRALPYR